MIRERAVALAEEPRPFDIEAIEEPGRHERPDAVSAIHDDLESSLQRAGTRDDVVDVGIDDLPRANASLSCWKFAGDREAVDLLDLLAVYRGRAERQLESVVLGRIVRAGDLDPAGDREMIERPVEERCRHLSDVDHIESGLGEPAHERIAQLVAARPVVAADGHRAR